MAAEQVMSTDREDAVDFTDAKINELSKELISLDECIAMLIEAEVAATQEVDDLRVQNEILVKSVSILEAELVQAIAAAAPIVEERGSMEDIIAKLEVAIFEEVKIDAALQEREDTNLVLIQQLELECETHQGTREDVSSLQTRFAAMVTSLAKVVKKINCLEG